MAARRTLTSLTSFLPRCSTLTNQPYLSPLVDMHRVIAVQSLKFYEQRQQENQKREERSGRTQHRKGGDANAPPHAHPSSSAQEEDDGVEKSNDEEHIFDLPDSSWRQGDRHAPRHSLVMTPLAPFDAADSHVAKDSSSQQKEESHDKTITIIYHDKKDLGIADHVLAATSSAAKTQSVILVDEIVRKRREKLKRSPVGVWHGLGFAYQVGSEVDLDLVSVTKGTSIRNQVKQKRSKPLDKESGEATRKVEALIDAFRAARVKMMQTSHESIREREREREKAKEAERERRERASSGFDDEEEDSERWHTKTKVALLPCLGQSPSNASPKYDNTIDSANTDHQGHTNAMPLDRARLEKGRLWNITRWRNNFDTAKQRADRQLIKALVSRAEKRSMAFTHREYLQAAVATIIKRQSNKCATNMLQGEEWQKTIENELGFPMRTDKDNSNRYCNPIKQHQN